MDDPDDAASTPRISSGHGVEDGGRYRSRVSAYRAIYCSSDRMVFHLSGPGLEFPRAGLGWAE